MSRVRAMSGALLAAAVTVGVMAASATPASADDRNVEPGQLAAAAAGGGLVAGITRPTIQVTLLGGASVLPDTFRDRADVVAGDSRRIAGSDRFRTAVSVSRAIAPNGAGEVVLASGVDFPDALSAAPLASRLRGPLLLVPRDALPSSVAAELARLSPTRVTVVGGPGVVSARVADAARAAAGGASVALRRIYGSDRYSTSAKVAGYFAAGGAGAVLASGAAFPDGVSAGPVAAALRGPLLLTPPTSLPPSVGEQLVRLAPGRLVVAGGTSAVSARTVAAAESATGATAERASGADRYATSSALAAIVAQLRKATGAYLATGQGFADALVGGVGAATQGGPVLLTAPGKGALASVAADLARSRRVGTWLQLSLDLLARQQKQPPTAYVAYDAAYQAASIATLYGWGSSEALAQLSRLRSVKKPDGGYGMERAWDAFSDGSVNPPDTSYLVSVTDHAGVGLLVGLRAGEVQAAEVGDLVDLVMAWPRVTGDEDCLAYSTAVSDRRFCVYNVNSSASWFLQSAWDAGVRRPGQQELAQRLYAHDVSKASGGWWPYSSNHLTTRQDWNHNAAMIDFQFQLDVEAGRASLASVMPGGWVHPDRSTVNDVQGYMRLLPYACSYRDGVPEAARILAAKQKDASESGQLALWSIRTTASCGPN
ncbi:cell wall-binding repeat-containing protein [Phycicoccus sp. Root101]|uniref:cell wall-binding repeat-containing protein n=1 Tax=Phycicoccus sp. Root101 TaxID=1736421 RepID=UPI0012FA5374|nr:cell wall-binding repeat-containing protein [Phycicoccus sp. Root101]